PPLGEHQARGLGGRRALLRGAVRLLGSAVLLRWGPVGLLLPVLLGRLAVPGRRLLAVARRRLLGVSALLRRLPVARRRAVALLLAIRVGRRRHGAKRKAGSSTLSRRLTQP